MEQDFLRAQLSIVGLLHQPHYTSVPNAGSFGPAGGTGGERRGARLDLLEPRVAVGAVDDRVKTRREGYGLLGEIDRKTTNVALGTLREMFAE